LKAAPIIAQHRFDELFSNRRRVTLGSLERFNY
jgi:hypothetical protein